MDDLGTKLDYTDYCSIPEDGQRHEIIDGAHFVNPAPTPRHQSASLHLAIELVATIERAELGRVLTAPIDVQLSEHDIVQPDLVVILADNAHIIAESRIVGAPDLVVEILSPSTVKHDRERKFTLYEKSGVHEYWLVDSSEQIVSQFALSDGRYERAVTSRERIRLCVLPECTIDMSRIWG
ncbi:MAG: Uma2 family endonuclease [Planctomycetes bacterium]|nr:Uma2 family endonuclease [Planctomycetota bacterium]MCB9917926.1 Uma2 family endonuclease [Planctomycetota bacterium]